jgi:hypothetical protein
VAVSEHGVERFVDGSDSDGTSSGGRHGDLAVWTHIHHTAGILKKR